MTANEVMVLARSGELRQLGSSIKDDDATLITFINLGLTEIYKRFVLKTDEAIITLADGKNIYKLDGTDADVSMGTGEYMYLISAYEDGDANNDYTTDDRVLPINSEDDNYSINTVTYNEVQIPLVTSGAFVSLIYAAKPTKVTVGTLDAELDIPDTLIDPLLEYIGYRGYKGMGDRGQSEDDILFLRFEQSCDRVRELGVAIAPDDLSMNERLNDRGFL
jgi:hypothetical protein